MSRYEPLTRFLEAREEEKLSLGFGEIEAIIGRSLPASAREHQAWWSNTETHSHADSWMRPGWRTQELNLAEERIAFVHSPLPPRRPTLANAPSSGRAIVLDRDSLSLSALSLVERHAAEHSRSLAEAIADLLSEAAVERKRRLLDRFPLTGERSSIDSVALIREDRDAR